MCAHLFSQAEVAQHILKLPGQSLTSMGLRDFNDVQGERQRFTLVLKVDGKRGKRTVIRRGPTIGGEAEFSRVILETVIGE